MTPADRHAHPTAGQLGDYQDGLLAPGDARRVAAHLAACATCTGQLRALGDLLDRAAALPSSIEPPADLWPEVRARIAPRPARRASPGPVWGRAASFAAAAAVLLVLAAAAATRALVGDRPPSVTTLAAAPAAAPTAAGTATARAADYRRIDAEYARAAAQLRAAVDAERGALAPATLATLDESLRAIDAALGEARLALERDPHNPALVEMFSASYEQKLALLKRTASLPSQL